MSRMLSCSLRYLLDSNICKARPSHCAFSRIVSIDAEVEESPPTENELNPPAIPPHDPDIFGIDSDEGVIHFRDDKPIQMEKYQYLIEKRKKRVDIMKGTSFGFVRLDSENPVYSRHLTSATEMLTKMKPFKQPIPEPNSKKKMAKLSAVGHTLLTELSVAAKSNTSLPKNANVRYTANNVDESSNSSSVNVASRHSEQRLNIDPKTLSQGSVVDNSEETLSKTKLVALVSNELFKAPNNLEVNKQGFEICENDPILKSNESERLNYIDEQYFEELSKTEAKVDEQQDFSSDIDHQYFSDIADISLNKTVEKTNILHSVQENLQNSGLQHLEELSDVMDLKNSDMRSDHVENELKDREEFASEIDLQYFNKIARKPSKTFMKADVDHAMKESLENVEKFDSVELSENQDSEYSLRTYSNQFVEEDVDKKEGFSSEIDRHYCDERSKEPFGSSKQPERVDWDSSMSSTAKFVPPNIQFGQSEPEVEESIEYEDPEEDMKILNEELRDADKVELDEQKDSDSSNALGYALKMKKATYSHNSLKSEGEFFEGTVEKVDSKGFRILSTQVPDLSLLTRDELVELLKNRVLFSNDDVVILNKPYNLIMHEAKTNKDPSLSAVLDDLAHVLDRSNKNPKLFTVHRLDKETTGCLLLARNELTAQYLKSLFVQRKIGKTYWVVTTHVPDPLEGLIDIPISEGRIKDKSRMVLHPNLPKDVTYKSHSKHGKQAITHYRVIATSGNAALIEAKPETGLKHQIRVHFGFGLGCPILGDHKYSYIDKLVPQKLPSDLLQRLYVRQSKVRHIPMHIHARKIIVPQFINGKNLFAHAPLPDHMRRNLQRLKIRKNVIKPQIEM